MSSGQAFIMGSIARDAECLNRIRELEAQNMQLLESIMIAEMLNYDLLQEIKGMEEREKVLMREAVRYFRGSFAKDAPYIYRNAKLEPL